MEQSSGSSSGNGEDELPARIDTLLHRKKINSKDEEKEESYISMLLKKNEPVNRSCIQLSKLSGVGESPTENALLSNVSRSPVHGRSIKKSGCMFQPSKQEPLCLKRGVLEPIKHMCEASMIPATWNYKGKRVKDVRFDAK
ncbi:hypothetical protein J4Q44_G00253470, partial [Coregonus suidteri]